MLIIESCGKDEANLNIILKYLQGQANLLRRTQSEVKPETLKPLIHIISSGICRTSKRVYIIQLKLFAVPIWQIKIC